MANYHQVQKSMIDSCFSESFGEAYPNEQWIV